VNNAIFDLTNERRISQKILVQDPDQLFFLSQSSTVENFVKISSRTFEQCCSETNQRTRNVVLTEVMMLITCGAQFVTLLTSVVTYHVMTTDLITTSWSYTAVHENVTFAFEDSLLYSKS